MTDIYRLPTAPQTIGRVLDAGTKLYLASFSRVVALALIGQFAMLVPQMVSHGFSKGTWLGADSLSIVGLAAVAVIASVGPYLAVVQRSWRIANGDDMPAADALRAGFRGIPRVILAGIAYGLVVSLGFLLLIIPGIYLAGALALFLAPLIFENAGALASLSRSRELMRGHWWRGTTVLAVPLILVTVVMLVIQLLPLFMFGIDTSSGDFKPTPLMEFLSGVIGMFLSGLLGPWSIGVMIALYNDLRLRREGDDLSQRLAGLSATS